MPKPIINGTLEPVKQPTEYQFERSKGITRVDRWEGAGAASLTGLANQLLALGTQYTFTPSPGKSLLVATATGPENGQPEQTTDTWQIVANENQKSLFEHPKAIAAEAASPNALGYVKRDVDLYNKGEPLGAPAPPASVGWLFRLLIRGTTHFASGQYVLKHTTNVSATYSTNVADTNVEKLYTTAQLVTEVTDANAWAFPLPGRLKYKLENIPAPAALTGYLWSWRKLPSTEGTAGNGRIEINTEYWLELWSTDVYDPVP